MSETITSPKLTWNVQEISEVTGLSTQYLRREIKRGALPAQRFGRRVLVRDSVLQTYLENGKAYLEKEGGEKGSAAA